MADKISADGDHLLAHARKVSRLADDVGEAAGALGSINLAGGAFGVMCAWMIPPAAAVSAAVVSQVEAVENAMSRTSSELTSVASDFDATETQHLTTIRGLRAVIE